MSLTTGVNWIAAFNRLFLLMDRKETSTYCSGPKFLRTCQQIDPGVPGYDQLIQLRNRQGKSTSRSAFYWDIFQAFPEPQKFQFFRIFGTPRS